MKQISIYFGKQQDGVLGSYADIVKLEPVDDRTAKGLLDAFCDGNRKWFGIPTPKGVKYINLDNVLWFDINDVDEKGDESGTKN